MENEKHARLLRSQAKHLLVRQKFGEAAELLTQALRLSPESYKLYRLRSLAHACLHDYDASLQDSEVLIRLKPRSPDGYYHKGYALYHKDDFAGAAHEFQNALEFSPWDRILRQGFWDAMTLMSQCRSTATGGCEDIEQVGLEGNHSGEVVSES